MIANICNITGFLATTRKQSGKLRPGELLDKVRDFYRRYIKIKQANKPKMFFI